MRRRPMAKTRNLLPSFALAVCLLHGFALTIIARQEAKTPVNAALTELKTVAESSGFTATSRHKEVLEFQQTLANTAPHVSIREVGQTVNGRSLKVSVVAKPDYEFGDQDDNRLVVLLLGNIHSGECAGKEGLLMLLRELAADPEHPWLKDIVVVCLPNYNADGNDRIGRNEIHRPGQLGPANGMGLRENAQQLDLNRDFIKIESPEARTLVALIDEINPHLFIDCHTTNGSLHRYQLTYDIPHNPTAPSLLRDFMRNEMMPSITDELERTGISTFYYGNFNRDKTLWTTYGHQPRYSTEYVGLRGRLAVLSEAYSYISYKDRIFASKAFVTQCIEYVKKNRAAVQDLLDEIEAAARQSEQATISLEAEVQAFQKSFSIKGYDSAKTDQPKDYEVKFFGKYVSTKSKPLPSGYVLSKDFGRVADRLLMHGIEVFAFQDNPSIDCRSFSIDQINRSRKFQKHRMLSVTGSWSDSVLKIDAGDYWIPTAQPLGRLAAYLLEPESDDGLTTWNFFDSSLEVDPVHPVRVVENRLDAKVAQIKSVPASSQFDLTRLYGAVGEGDAGKVEFGGELPDLLEWVSDAQYRTRWNGREVLVDVETGRLSRTAELSEAAAISRLMTAGINRDLAQKIAGGKRIDLQTAVIFNGENDLFWVSKSENTATRLTSTDTVEELVVASPDESRIAFVRQNDLYSLNLETGTETRHTTDGNENRLNGKLDWVYQEELYGRGNFKGFWWSPNSQELAFLKLDQSQVLRYQVTDNIPVRQSHEVYPYPKAGDPNPRVRLFVAGKEVPLDPFGFKEPLISQVCWSPDGRVVFQCQNRIQNIMKLVQYHPKTRRTKLLVEEKAANGWIDSPGNPIWIDDGSGRFVWFTHRGKKRQIATYDREGKILEPGVGFTQAPDNPVEIRSLVGVTTDGVLVTATPANDPTRIQLFRLNKQGELIQLTDSKQNHGVKFNDSMTYFFDTASTVNTPPRIALRRVNGEFVRYVAPNLVDHLDYYDIVSPEFKKIANRNGELMDAMILYPPNFDRSKQYPVLMHVYAGPQAPRVRNRWGGTSLLWHQMMAQKGFIVWMCDNRSASHRGLDQTWPIYRDLGRRELQDIEDSLKWLKSNLWVDPARIGIWGWSYGGYMTSYAMTHSTTFKAGIAGAPVTDWRNYDSIYTERYMGLPQDNSKGYDASSVVKAASNLSGRLMIIHGTQDDNVHISNTYQLIEALQQAGKSFELMIYPKNRHGIRIPNQMRHLRRLMTDFFLRNL